MSRALIAFLLVLLPASAQEYWHRLSGTVGGINSAGGFQSDRLGSAPMLSFDYGYRFHRHSQADVGVDIGFPTDKLNSTRRNLYIPRFGYRAVVPLMQDRLEASIGAGAGHSFLKPTIQGYESWLVYLQGGVNYAIDKDKRYWGGLVLRWYRDPVGSPVQQWISVGAQFTFSTGR